MIPIEFIRQFRIFEYAIFDFAVVFVAMYLLAPLLSKLLLKSRVKIPKQNWLYLTLPISIFVHMLVGRLTPMTRNFFDVNGYYLLKVLVIGLLILGVRKIRITKKRR